MVKDKKQRNGNEYKDDKKRETQTFDHLKKQRKRHRQ